MRLFLTALGFLTILPVRVKSENQAGSLAFFPLAGLFLGVCLVVLEYILAYSLPASLVRLILIAFLIFVTGGLHLDGFADTVDAIASGEKGDTALRIMREPAVGPVGAAAVFLLLLAKYITLGEFFGWRLYAMLLFFPMAGRMGMVVMCWMFPYARNEGTGMAFVQNAEIKQLITAFLTALMAGVFLYGMRAVFILGFIFIVAILFGKFFVRRVGGITGDTIGFINELGELVALIGGTVVI